MQHSKFSLFTEYITKFITFFLSFIYLVLKADLHLLIFFTGTHNIFTDYLRITTKIAYGASKIGEEHINRVFNGKHTKKTFEGMTVHPDESFFFPKLNRWINSNSNHGTDKLDLIFSNYFITNNLPSLRV